MTAARRLQLLADALATVAPRPKPAPDVFLHAAAEFGVEPKDAVVIEDSTHGIHGAKAAGMEPRHVIFSVILPH